MKTKETSTLYTTMSNNIGQVKKENAQKEIERLNKQENTNSWRIDESDFMFVEDETDDNVHNPCERREGYVWITCEPLSTRTTALAWWRQLCLSCELDDTHYVLDNLMRKHIGFERRYHSLTGREIEEIWRNEVQIPTLRNAEHNLEYLEKPNKKDGEEIA